MSKEADLRIQFFKDLDAGKLTLVQATRRLRKSTSMTQPQLAKLLKISERTYIDLERGVGNPTLKTLSKIAAAYGLEVSFRKIND